MENPPTDDKPDPLFPRLACWRDEPTTNSVVFWFDYKNKRHKGEIPHALLGNAALAPSRVTDQNAFSRDCERILQVAAAKVDQKDFTPDGTVFISGTHEYPAIPY